MSTCVGKRGVASTPNSSGDVSPSNPFVEKGGGMHGLLRPLTWPPMSGPTGRCLHHPGSGALDQQGKKLGTYTTRCINSEGYQGPHPVGQNAWRNWLGMWCPPWKTTWGGRKANHQKNHRRPDWQMSGLCGARPPEGGGGAPPPRETLPRQGKPIKEP